MRSLTIFILLMWLLVVSWSSDYWLGTSPPETSKALVDVEVCLGILLCVTRWVPRVSRGLILGSTGRGAPHSWEHWKGAPLFVSRQCFPNSKFYRTVALIKGMFTATTILPQTKAPKQVIPLGDKTTIVGTWLFCVGQRHQDCQVQTLLTPTAPTSFISTISKTVITNFIHFSLHGRYWKFWNH